MPSAVTPHQKIIHSSAYLTSIHSILSSVGPSRRGSAQVPHHPVKVAVVGGGQSAAEVVIDLRSKLQDVIPLFPDADGNPMRHEIELIINRGSLKPCDGSPFSNEIFDPSCACANIHSQNLQLILSSVTDLFFELGSEAAKRMVLREFQTTNYGVVNPRTIDDVSRVTLVSGTPSHPAPALRVGLRTTDGRFHHQTGETQPGPRGDPSTTYLDTPYRHPQLLLPHRHGRHPGTDRCSGR